MLHVQTVPVLVWYKSGTGPLPTDLQGGTGYVWYHIAMYVHLPRGTLVQSKRPDDYATLM